ncbi:MAG: DUF1592 domain-containing protein [Bryobacterales bacterium]
MRRLVPLACLFLAPGLNAADLTALTERYCLRCHNAQTQNAGIDFTALLSQKPLVRNAETWERVIAIVESNRMPPEGALQPAPEERESLLAALDHSIRDFDYSQIDDPGFEPLRRLTHREYDNTIRDLFGIELNPTQRFTEELKGASGFDNSANSLFLQSTLMERYIAAAERIVEDAFEHPEARDLIFIAHPGAGLSEEDAAARVLERFLLRAFRRPANQAELVRAKHRFQAARAAGQAFEEAVKRVIEASLISPNFLFRIETAPEGARATPVTDWELASRLSYFLWATMPDDELFSLAAKNELHQPATLEGQFRRMLADPKADTLGTDFAGQWLGFEYIGTRIRMGPIDFPWCTDSLMDAMRAESSLFFLSLVRENQPIPRLLDADYTFLNHELAQTLYGMEGVEGDQMRRVKLTDPNRGGILGQGSTLAVTSNYNQTSPVKRGHWILETLLGTPPPPPPPNAGVLPAELSAKRDLTFREKLAMHSANETCRACHAKIDPLGFSLENFDYFGRWREDYIVRVRVKEPEDPNVDPPSNFERVHKPIDAAGKLPEGVAFEGPAGLKRALLASRQDDLIRQTVRKMLSYALGRQLEYYDESAVRRLIADLESDNYRFQTLLRGILDSYPFRYKKNPTTEAD